MPIRNARAVLMKIQFFHSSLMNEVILKYALELPIRRQSSLEATFGADFSFWI